MPRRSTGAVRSSLRQASRGRQARPEFPGIPRRVRSAILRAEHRCLWPGAVDEALLRYRRFLAKPGRYLYPSMAGEPDRDPVAARDTLEAALRQLAALSRARLGRIVARLDDEFVRRTLADPRAATVSPWHAEHWWRQRLSGPYED